MKSIKQIMNEVDTPFTGSSVTRSLVEEAIREKYGDAEVKKLDPYHNLRTYRGWLSINMQVRAKETAIRSFTISEVKNAEGKVIKKIKRPVFLFYYLQLQQPEKVGPKSV